MRNQRTHPVIRVALLSLGGLLVTMLALWLAAAPPAAGQSPETAALPSQLPVYKLLAPAVNNDSALRIGNLFNQVGAQEVVTRPTHRGTESLALVNTNTEIIFEQFRASGGFRAFHIQAFGDGSVRGALDADAAKALACNFLQSRQLFPAEATFTDCAVDAAALPYPTIIGQRTVLTQSLGSPGVNVSAAISTTEQIGIIVQVPLALAINRTTFIRLAGPGGHLSLLFVSTDQQNGPVLLDSNYRGLAAVAEPWFGRSLQSRGDYDIVPLSQAMAAAAQRLRQEFVGASSVDPGTPEVVYWADEAEAEQENLMPMWLFENATATVDGETFTARAFTLPGVEDFLPDVQITSPADGSQYWAGRPFTLTGQIQGGSGPYAYRWLQDDGTVLASDSSSGPEAELVTSALPFVTREGAPAEVVVRLEATDENGATASDGVRLLAGPRQVFLPTIARAGGVGASGDVSVAAPPYRMGVEWVQFYNDVASDLPGTSPDANGFYNQLQSYGWSGVFKWSNNGAWEKDWRDCSLGGADCTYGVDRADYAYFSGHGSPRRILFGVEKDAYRFQAANARYQNLRWVSFSSCNTIRGGSTSEVSPWFNAFQGVHMLLGFHSVMADIAFGGPVAYNMKVPWFPFIGELPSLQMTIPQAWVKTAFDMNAGRPSYLYAVGTNGVNPANNKLPKGSAGNLLRPFPVASYHWVWWSLPGD